MKLTQKPRLNSALEPFSTPFGVGKPEREDLDDNRKPSRKYIGSTVYSVLCAFSSKRDAERFVAAVKRAMKSRRARQG